MTPLACRLSPAEERPRIRGAPTRHLANCRGRLPPALARLADRDPRIVVLLLILLSAVPRPGGRPACSDARPMTSTSPTSTASCAAAFVLVRSSTGPSAAACRPAPEAYIQILGDLGLVTLLVYSSGGPDSVFTFLYLVVIGAAGLPPLPHRRRRHRLRRGRPLRLDGRADRVRRPAPSRRGAALSDWTGPSASATTSRSRSSGFSASPSWWRTSRRSCAAAREELERRQKALSRSRHLYANVIASMSSGLVTTDSRQRVTFLNRAGRRDARHRPGARRTGRPLAEIGLPFPSDWDEHPPARAGPARPTAAEIEIVRDDSAPVLGYSRARV